MTERIQIHPRPHIVGPAPNRVGFALALVLVVVGQTLASGVFRAAADDKSPAVLLNRLLKLEIPGDPAPILVSGLFLLAGMLVFALVTRRQQLVGDFKGVLESPVLPKWRLSTRWTMAAAAGAFAWLVVLQWIVDGGKGWVGTLPWLFALGLIGACLWKADRMRGVQHAIRIERWDALALGLAAVAVYAVFTFRLEAIPARLQSDEGLFFSTARDIATGRFIPDVFGLGVYGFPMLSTIYHSIWMSLFGATVWAWRLGSAVAALLAIVPMYFLARSTLGWRVALVSLALYAASPYVLAYARIGYNNSQSIALVASTLALIWLAVRRKSYLFAFCAGCAGGLGFLSYTAAQLGVLLALGWLAWLWMTRQVAGRSVLPLAAIYALGVLLVAAPVVVYGTTRYPEIYSYKHYESLFANVFYARGYFTDGELFSTFAPIQVGDQQLFFEPGAYAMLLGRGLIRTALSFHVPDLVYGQHYLLAGLAEPFAAVYVLGAGWCLARLRRPGYVIWPVWLGLGAFLLSVLNTFPPRPAHMLPIVPALAVLGAVGIVSVIDGLAATVPDVSDRAKWVGLTLIVAVMVFSGLRLYFVEMPRTYPPDIENAMFWEAQRLPRGSDITLIQIPGIFPDDFQPWGMRELDLGVRFHLVSLGSLDSISLYNGCPGDCRFFFDAAAYDLVVPGLTGLFGNGTLVSYPDPDLRGRTQFYSFAPSRLGR